MTDKIHLATKADIANFKLRMLTIVVTVAGIAVAAKRFV